MRHRFPSQAASDGHRAPRRHVSLVVGVLIAAVALLSGCGAFNDDEEDRGYWSPFHSQSNWSMNGGSMRLELNGFERGHEPGQSSEFEFTIENRRDQGATLDVCVQLLDEEQVLQHLESFEIELGPDAAGRRTFTAEFDPELEPRAYGLAVVIADVGAVVHTVRLGIADDEAGPWLDAGELSCAPA